MPVLLSLGGVCAAIVVALYVLELGPFKDRKKPKQQQRPVAAVPVSDKRIAEFGRRTR